LIEEVILHDSKPDGKTKAKVIRVGLRVPDANDSSILLYSLDPSLIRLPLVITNEAGKLMVNIWATAQSTKEIELHSNDPFYPPPTHSIEIELDIDNKEKHNGKK